MPPPAWLIERWKEHKNWVRRFVEGSFELNSILCGVPIDKSATMWKPAAVRDFLKYMESVKRVFTKPITLYRGTAGGESPTMSPISFDIRNCQFISTSKSQEIAKEFAGKKGYVHEFHISKGVEYYDLEEIYANDPIKREKEVILYPNCRLQLISYSKQKLVWKVSP
jgi:hypothetical protein